MHSGSELEFMSGLPRVQGSRRWWTSLTILMLLSSGCHSLSHHQAKIEAQQRWKTARANIQYRLASQQFGGGEFEEAAQTAAQSLALDPTSTPAYVLLARAYLELGQIASANQTLENAARSGLESAELDYARGIVFEQQNRFDDAISAYAQAHERDGTSVAYFVALVECLVTVRRTNDAQRLLDEDAFSFDSDGTVSVLRAHVATLAGEEAETVSFLREAHRKSPGNRLVREELGRLLARAGRYSEALSVLEPLLAASDTSPASGTVHRAIAKCHLAEGDPLAARILLSRYTQTHPGDTPAQLLLAKAALATNDMLTAMRAIDLAQQRASGRSELKLVRAAVRWKRGSLDAAATDLRDVIAMDPTDVEAHCLLGEVLSTGKDLDAARRQFRLALQLDPNCDWATAGLNSIRQRTKPSTRPKQLHR